MALRTSLGCVSRGQCSTPQLSADSCLAGSIDHASYGGRLYSDKAPGLSVLALPAVALVRLPTQSGWGVFLDLRLWVVRLLTAGIAFVACVFLVGRVAEGLAPGWGGAVLVTFALGTMISSLAISTFEEVPAATLGFAAFLLAWAPPAVPLRPCGRRRDPRRLRVVDRRGDPRALRHAERGSGRRPLSARAGAGRRPARSLRLGCIRLAVSSLVPVRHSSSSRAASTRGSSESGCRRGTARALLSSATAASW